MTQIICTDCLHYRPRTMRVQGMEDRVIHNCRGVRNLITGATTESSCAVVRGKGGVCGPAGKLFEERAKALEAAE